jgi:hypothetical protein
MAGEIVASNALLLDRANDLRSLLDTSHAIWLFKNDFRPTPKHILTDFVESSFPGYTRQALAGEWNPVFKVIDGEYQFSSHDFSWFPTGPTNELCYGWYVTDGIDVKLSSRLPFPMLMTVGASLTIRIDVQNWALSLL